MKEVKTLRVSWTWCGGRRRRRVTAARRARVICKIAFCCPRARPARVGGQRRSVPGWSGGGEKKRAPDPRGRKRADGRFEHRRDELEVQTIQPSLLRERAPGDERVNPSLKS